MKAIISVLLRDVFFINTDTQIYIKLLHVEQLFPHTKLYKLYFHGLHKSDRSRGREENYAQNYSKQLSWSAINKSSEWMS